VLVVIEADENTAHKYIVDVMDRAKSAGLQRLAIATRPKN
jgi:biopolymer transport protein ExbD